MNQAIPMMHGRYCFFYGTLMSNFHNPLQEEVIPFLTYVGPARINGYLYDIGGYPGLVPDASGGQVYGEVYELPAEHNELLVLLDDYEGIGKQHREPYEYQRVMLPVQLDEDKVNGWVYAYNAPLNNCPLIPSGDYRTYRRQTC